MLARVGLLLRIDHNIYEYCYVIKMKSTEFIFALVLVLMLPETSSSPSIFSVMYVPRFTELAQLGLGEMMWGDNTVDWERLHTTVSMQTRDGRKAGCRYRVSVVPVDGDGLPIAVIRGQARELGCEVQLCGLNDGDEECVISNGNYSDVMGKCHLSIPTSLAEAGNGYRWVGVESTAISVEAGCQLSSESLPGLTALLEPYTAVYECASDEFWSQDVQECLPCETDDTTYLCSPGFYVKGCDSLAHVLDESTICSPCPNTPTDFASGRYRWSEGEECVLECDPGLFYMNGTVCEPCTEVLRTCTDEESNHCCAKQAGQMWRACTATENEACVDCPAISKSIYSENEEFIPWSHECEHYLQEDGDLSALCECHTTCKDGFYRSLEPDLLDTLPCVPCSGMVDLAVQARLTRTSNEFFRYQQCTKASNTQLVQCVGKPIGCDGVPYSTVVVDICGVCGGSNDTCTGCDGVIASGKVEDACGLCGGDNTTCAGCDGVPNSGLVVDVCDQCGGDNTSCWGCDNVSNSGLVFDACGECGGDGSSCWGCDNVSNSGLVFDACDECGGNNATCTGCDGVLFSGKVPDSCGVCDGGDQAQDGCGVCYGDNTSCVGCDGIFKSGVFNDSCGVCGGDNSTCAGCDGIPYSGNVIDFCGVCGGDNTSCIGCDGVFYSGIKYDECNVCGGDNTSCECDIGYTGPRYGKLSDSCVPCGPGTYKDVIGSAACMECGFNTYNPEYGSTSSDACLPCMEHSETEEIYGHESIHACMCKSGYYHDTLTSCSACIPGTFNAENNQTQCSNCSAGYHSSGPNSSTCAICPNATYSHEGSALCTPCNLNASSPEGSDSIGDCVCDVGFYSDITEHSQFGKVSTEFATTSSTEIRDVKLSNNGQWAVFVDTFNIYHIDLSIPERTITTVKTDVFASSVCLDSTNNNIIYGDGHMHLTSVDLTNPSSPVSSNLLTSIPSNKRVQGACVVTSDRFVIFTDLKHIYEYSFSTNSVYRTISNLGEYNGDARIYALTVTGENDNIIIYSSNHKIWKLNRVYDVNPVLVAGSYEGSLDGAYNVAQFVHPSALTMSADHKTIYLNTERNIRAIDYETGTVSTVAGALVSSTTGDDGCTDGARNEATFFFNTGGLGGMTLSADGANLLVPGWACHNVRRVNLVTQITSHCKACAAGTYKTTIGPQACEPCVCEACESCPAGQYRLGCTTLMEEVPVFTPNPNNEPVGFTTTISGLSNQYWSRFAVVSPSHAVVWTDNDGDGFGEFSWYDIQAKTYQPMSIANPAAYNPLNYHAQSFGPGSGDLCGKDSVFYIVYDGCYTDATNDNEFDGVFQRCVYKAEISGLTITLTRIVTQNHQINDDFPEQPAVLGFGGCIVTNDNRLVYVQGNYPTYTNKIIELDLTTNLLAKTYEHTLWSNTDFSLFHSSTLSFSEESNTIYYSLHTFNKIYKIDRGTDVTSEVVDLTALGGILDVEVVGSDVIYVSTKQSIYSLDLNNVSNIKLFAGSGDSPSSLWPSSCDTIDGASPTFNRVIKMTHAENDLLHTSSNCHGLRQTSFGPILSHTTTQATCSTCPGNPGTCVDCPSCADGQYRVNCANQSTGECVACLAHGNITWLLEDADEGLTGGSSPDQSCDQICAEQNLMCDQTTLDGPIRYNNEAPALLFLEDIVRDSGYDQLSGSNEYNAVGDDKDECRIVPYFAYYPDYGYGFWIPEAREQHACTQTSQCSAIASDIPLSTSYKYQRLCPCTCGANHYLDGCGGNSSGVCRPCASCPTGQYRQNCSLYDPGVCVNCSSCPQGQIISGCEGHSAGQCQQCCWEQQLKPGDVVAVKISSEVCMPGYYLTQCMYTSASQYSDLTLQYDLESITGAIDRGFWIFTVSDSFLHTDNTFRYTMIRNSNSATVTWLHDGYQNDVLCLNGRVAEFPSGACGLSDCH